jgi:hypothetical protein
MREGWNVRLGGEDCGYEAGNPPVQEVHLEGEEKYVFWNGRCGRGRDGVVLSCGDRAACIDGAAARAHGRPVWCAGGDPGATLRVRVSSIHPRSEPTAQFVAHSTHNASRSWIRRDPSARVPERHAPAQLELRACRECRREAHPTPASVGQSGSQLLAPATSLLALAPDTRVRQPDLGHQIALGEHRQDTRVDLVGLAHKLAPGP